jgi:hypothetical protein
MNSIDLRLLELLQIAETPVYSAYRWLSRELGRELSMAEFFRLLSPLLEGDVVRMWAVDIATQKRLRWSEVPPDLQAQYMEVPDLDDSFDPFGLSLALGPAADLNASPDWEVEFDFEKPRFVVTARPHALESALQQVRRLFPDLDFAEKDRGVAGDRVRITGLVTERPAAGQGD